MISSSFQELAFVTALAGAFAIVARWLGQPIILAYIAAGVIAGQYELLNLNNRETLNVMAQLGITLLLFLVGLEMNVKELKNMGFSSVVTGAGQVAFTLTGGLILVKLLGFDWSSAFYTAAALTFSSTIIVVKILGEKNELHTLHGKLAVGTLLIQDLIAVLLLVVLAGVGVADSFTFTPLFFAILKAALLFSLVWIIGVKVIPPIVGWLAHSTETLFVASMAWALFVAWFISSPLIGFSIEIGGFLAGLSLAASAQHYQIDARLRPLRDFFIMVFFVVLGSTLALKGADEIWWPVTILSIFVLIGNPLIVMILLGAMGFARRTGFMVGLGMAQISEFSLILMALGARLGHANEKSVAVVTAVGVVTILISSYMLTHANDIFRWIEPYLGLFERKKLKEKQLPSTLPYEHLVLIGVHRVGSHIIEGLAKPENCAVVDYDPERIQRFEGKVGWAVYGDIMDVGIQEAVNLSHAKIIISTIPDIGGQLRLAGIVRDIRNSRKEGVPYFIALASREWEAQELYNAGADYVVIPHFVGGRHLASVIDDITNEKTLRKLRFKDQTTIATA